MDYISSFQNWLTKKGYKQYTDAGNPSVVYDYSRRVTRIAEEFEGITIQQLAQNINKILPKYLPGGSKEEIGMKSHNAFKCALVQFKEFLDE